jgi:maltose alpha-D-glucosyltransferase/alpha-amylase
MKTEQKEASDLSVWVNQNIEQLVSAFQPAYFKSKRWFGSKGRNIKDFKLIDYTTLTTEPKLSMSVLVQINYSEGAAEFYHLPLLVELSQAVAPEIKNQPYSFVATISTAQGEYVAHDAFSDPNFAKLLFRYIYETEQFATSSGAGKFSFGKVGNHLASPNVETVKLISTEQSNTSVVYNDSLILKCFRKLSAGKNPDFEIPYFLTAHTNFTHVPKLAGYIEYDRDQSETFSMGVLQDFIHNIGDGYNYSLNQLRNFFQELEVALLNGTALNLNEEARTAQASTLAQPYIQAISQLGAITAELHNALASAAAKEDPAFEPEVIQTADIELWHTSILQLIDRVISTATNHLKNASASLRQQLETITKYKQDYLDVVGRLSVLEQAGVNKIRYHGDYHLGQVLKTEDSFVILDFEGEPARTLAERRAKYWPLKDVTGMLRSFSYAASTVLFEEQARLEAKVAASELEKWAVTWEQLARQSFLEGYMEVAHQNQGAKFLPDNPEVLQQAMDVFETEKAFYELLYEINNRPNWIAIPLTGLERIRAKK